MAESLTKVEALAHEALERYGADRDAFLMESCQGADALWEDVELLLERIETLVEQAFVRPRDEREAFLVVECRGTGFVYQEVCSLLVQREQTAIDPDQMTSLLLRLSQGDKNALDSLTPLVYDDLRRLARFLLRSERPNHTLQPTALVNEAYVKFTRQMNLQWQNRAHFVAIAARAMRQVLADDARRRKRQRHGGGVLVISLEDALGLASEQPVDALDLEEALGRLSLVSSRKAQVVELRYFGGLTNEEIAEVLHIAPNTVGADWKFAIAWLKRDMHRKETNGTGTTGKR